MKKIPILILITLIFNTFILSASDLNPKTLFPKTQSQSDFYKHYKGSINKTILIRLNLIRSGNSLNGTFYYEKVGQSIYLNGELKKDDSFVLMENVDAGTTGYFNGKFENDGTIKGIWQNGTKEKQFPFELHEDYSNSIEFKCYSISDSCNLLNKDSTPFCHYSATYFQPVNYKDKEMLKTLQQLLLKLVFDKSVVSTDPLENLIAKKKNYFSSYKESLNDMQYSTEMANTFMWETSVFIDIIFNDDYLFSLGTDYYEYSGGAHGMSGTSYITLDLKTGKKINEKDLFVNGFEPLLKEKLIKQLIAVKGFSTRDQLDNEGFSVENIAQNSNFYLDKNGICFHYNPYEIASYASGPTDLYITYKELKDLIKPNCPISGFLK